MNKHGFENCKSCLYPIIMTHAREGNDIPSPPCSDKRAAVCLEFKRMGLRGAPGARGTNGDELYDPEKYRIEDEIANKTYWDLYNMLRSQLADEDYI